MAKIPYAILSSVFIGGGRGYEPNDPSSATRPAGDVDCNRSAPAGFAAAHGWNGKSLTEWSFFHRGRDPGAGSAAVSPT